MSKSKETKRLESILWDYANKINLYRCFEVTMGISVYNDRERVDFMTYSSDGVIRCYEIKVTFEDFKSTAHKTFVGDYNYFVVTNELYEQIKDSEELKWYIAMGIGVFVDYQGVKIKPKHKVVTTGTRVMAMESMMRSLHREVNKYYREKPYWQ